MRILGVALAILCSILVSSALADPIKVEIGPTGTIGSTASPVNPSAAGDVVKLTEEEDDDEDFFDSAAMARHAEMLRENEKKAQAAQGAASIVEPPLPEGPIPKTQASYDWQDTDVTSSVWRAIHEGDLGALKRIVRFNNDAIHLRSADGRGGKFTGIDRCLHSLSLSLPLS